MSSTINSVIEETASNISNVSGNSLIMKNGDEKQQEVTSNGNVSDENVDEVIDDDVTSPETNVTSTNKPEKSFYRPEAKFTNRNDLQKYINQVKCFRHKSDNDTGEAKDHTMIAR